MTGGQGFRVTDQGMGALKKMVPENDEICVPIKTNDNRFVLVCL